MLADISTSLGGASEEISGVVSEVLGMGLSVGIVFVGGFVCWKAFKRLTGSDEAGRRRDEQGY